MDESARIGYLRALRRGLIIVDEPAVCTGFADLWRDPGFRHGYHIWIRKGRATECPEANQRSREFCRVNT